MLLDISLPGGSGLEIINVLKKKKSTAGIIIISAKNSLEDKIDGLNLGADDYLVKPFRMAELAARIRSLERRSERPYQPQQLCWGPLQLNVQAAEVSLNGRELILTGRERQLLEWFLRHPGRLVTRSHLLDQLWSIDADAGDETVKTHLNNLRRKLRNAGCADPIETVHGQGYRLVPEP